MILEEQVRVEFERANFAFSELKVADSVKARDFFVFVKSYFTDAVHFYDKGLLLEAFELFAYVWGLLDAGARFGFFDPGKARKHYKIDQG